MHAGIVSFMLFVAINSTMLHYSCVTLNDATDLPTSPPYIANYHKLMSHKVANSINIPNRKKVFQAKVELLVQGKKAQNVSRVNCGN